MQRSPLLAALAVCAVAAACGAPAPTARPTATALTVPSNDTRATPGREMLPPVMPALARKHTEAGAKAFVLYTVAQLNYSQATLQFRRLGALLSDSCAGCRGAIDYLAKVKRRHGRFEGGRISAASLDVTPLRAGRLKLMEVSFTYRSTKQRVYLGPKRVEVYDAGAANDRWILSPLPDGWIVTSWSVRS